MKVLTIAVCYKAGTQDMLRIWLSSLCAHTGWPVSVYVITADEVSRFEAWKTVNEFLPSDHELNIIKVSIPIVPVTRVHGAMLDAFLELNLASKFFMSMDSDCFPIADDWLDLLFKKMDDGARVVGILHPWIPPSEEMAHGRIEWRVRSQHCSNNTHVACQMLRTDDLKDLAVNYRDGDDTGLLIPNKARSLGWKIDGFHVTRCAKPQGNSDPEFNRHTTLVFGDKVYHQGAFTRNEVVGDKQYMAEEYKWVWDEVKKRKGADFLLSGEFSYQFKLDREEEVAADKMKILFGENKFGAL